LLKPKQVENSDGHEKYIYKLTGNGKYQSDNEEKYHIMIPKQFIHDVKDLKGKQVKVTLEDEI
jgi:hypothetical protein